MANASSGRWNAFRRLRRKDVALMKKLMVPAIPLVIPVGSGRIIAGNIMLRMLERFVFNDSLLAAVVTTFAADGVVDVPCAAIGAKSERGSYGLVVSATFSGAGF